ncbi:MAG: hypothetical protein WC314_01620 [Vulcanimicrobiota bacterium]
MLESLTGYDGSEAAQSRIRQAWGEPLNLSRQPGARTLVHDLEARVARDPAGMFQFDQTGFATLDSYQAGRFSCPNIGELRARMPEQTEPGKLALWLLEGSHPATDIGALQASAPPGSLFQVASQYNCLEAPSPQLVPVEAYFDDPTQGPRASISAFPATLLRHYQAPGPEGTRFVQQTDHPQLNLLHRVAWNSVAQVHNGYLTPARVSDPETFANLLQDHFEEIEIGHHENLQVVLGANWDGGVSGSPLIGQAFTSTLAAGLYGQVDFSREPWSTITVQLQRAAYLGTLLAAASSGCRYAVLTLIGGGVFGNPPPLIWDAIVWACRETRRRLKSDLLVVVNGRDLSHSMSLEKPTNDVREFGGEVMYLKPHSVKI